MITTPLDYAALVPQNPKGDPEGHVAYLAPDDRCYVEVPMKPPIPPLPTGGRPFDNVYVDCPPEMDDPAWDSCTWGTLSANTKKANDCVCIPMGGNPPPPPVGVACPKTVKR